jgi:PAS domain S-box-containing protein
VNTPILMLAREVEAPDRAVVATDAQGAIVYWGSGAHELYGWTEAEVLGRAVLDVTPAELSRDEADAIMKSLRAGDPWSGDFLVRGKEGRKFLARVTDIPVHDSTGRLLGIVGISRRSVDASA